MKKVMVFLAVSMMLWPIWATAGSNDGLVAYFSFNGTLKELISGKEGSSYNTNFSTDKYGSSNQSVVFKGGSSHISYGNIDAINNLNEQFSICFWIVVNERGIILDHDIIGTRSDDWYVGINSDDNIYFSFGNDSQPSNEVITDDMWHHICFLRDKNSGTFKIFVDGRKDAEFSNLFNYLTSTTFNVGSWDSPSGFSSGFKGKIDELRFYNRLLSESEISELAGGCSSNDRYEEGYTAGFEAGKEYCRSNPSACDIPVGSTSPNTPSSCASFNIFTNTLHVPCLDLGTENYWLDMMLEGTDPIRFTLTDFGGN